VRQEAAENRLGVLADNVRPRPFKMVQ
jgi:hypothetical protein